MEDSQLANAIQAVTDAEQQRKLASALHAFRAAEQQLERARRQLGVVLVERRMQGVSLRAIAAATGGELSHETVHRYINRTIEALGGPE